MSCEKYLPLVDDLIEGEIEGQNAEQINSHISLCEECSARYGALKQEKETYAHYLFDVEPPADLWAKFQSKMNAEEEESAAAAAAAPPHPHSRIPEKASAAARAARPSFRDLNIFRSLRLYPAAGFAVVLIVLGIGLFKAVSDKTVSPEQYAARKNVNDAQAVNNHSEETTKKEERDLPTINDSDKTVSRQQNLVKPSPKAVSSNKKSGDKMTNKIVAVKFTKKDEKSSSEGGKGKILIDAQPDEHQLRQSQLKNLESETARQAEKTELLLRSFRNARVVDGSSIYDVAYEKRQARKLLEQNIRLRQTAEAFGNLYAREILEKVEPLLLDIANLENNPAEEKVLDIKERVKNQNIIASLQVY